MMSGDSHAADSVRLDALARRISTELNLLLDLSVQLQDAMSYYSELRSHEVGTLGALQGIDRISQALRDLAHLTAEIGLRTPDSVRLERQPLDARLSLRDLSLRLHLHEAPSLDWASGDPTDLARAPGDVLLF